MVKNVKESGNGRVQVGSLECNSSGGTGPKQKIHSNITGDRDLTRHEECQPVIRKFPVISTADPLVAV
jgi:hypothetical protein